MTLTTNYWTKETVIADGEDHIVCDLKIDDSGNPHLLYSTTTESGAHRFICYAVRQAGVWSFQTIAEVPPWFPGGYDDWIGSLYLHPVTGTPHVVFTSSSDQSNIYQPVYQVSYAYLESGTWHVTANICEGTEKGQYPEIAISADGHVHVVYQFYVYGCFDAIRYATSSDGVNWSYETVVAATANFNYRIYGSWTVDSAGIPCFGNEDSVGGIASVVIWKRTGGTWTRYGTPRINEWAHAVAYQDANDYWFFVIPSYTFDLDLYTWNGSSWTTETWSGDIAVDGHGSLLVATDIHYLATVTDDYSLWENFYLAYISKKGTNWTSEVILDYDPTTGAGPINSIGLVNNSPVAVCTYNPAGSWDKNLYYLQRAQPAGHVYIYNVQEV
jgi:hypothetical protein